MGVDILAYRELIKNFERIRSYMREFYVYGFKSRSEYDAKSARSYDNERRRVESWLGDYMAFRQDASGKNVFLSVDSRRIPQNPLYRAFRAKSFTDRDITLHFYILDLLADGSALSAGEVADRINDIYLSRFPGTWFADESTIRKKLREYETLGLLRSQKSGREVLFYRTDNPLDLDSWSDALAFFAEQDPVGVIGAFLTDRLDQPSDIFRFKHHYILRALDSDVLCELLLAIGEQRSVELRLQNQRDGLVRQRTVLPWKIYISTQTGRQYLLGFHGRTNRPAFFRLDSIRQVRSGAKAEGYDRYPARYRDFAAHLWGVSAGGDGQTDHIELTLRHAPGETFLPQRLEREKRCGTVEILDEQTCRFTADVYDALEMLPWIRTFIGRIADLKCSNRLVTDRFREDLRRMHSLYGGDGDAVQ